MYAVDWVWQLHNVSVGPIDALALGYPLWNERSHAHVDNPERLHAKHSEVRVHAGLLCIATHLRGSGHVPRAPDVVLNVCLATHQ